MRSIKARFHHSRNTTTITQFYDAVKYQNFSEDRIRRWFNKLVDQDDYESSDKRAILQDLYDKTKIEHER